MAAEGISQVALAKMSGVDQASISRFLRMENPEGLSGESVLRIYPIVSGDPEASGE
jgi:predicted transcriptional regulator